MHSIDCRWQMKEEDYGQSTDWIGSRTGSIIQLSHAGSLQGPVMSSEIRAASQRHAMELRIIMALKTKDINAQSVS